MNVTWSKKKISKIQDGVRPPFWKSLYRHISVKNNWILMKFCTQQQILNWMNVTWSKTKKLHWTNSEFDRTYFLLPIRSTLPMRSTLLLVCIRAKSIRSILSTFNKVDRVEFNFVASVYPALGVLYGKIDKKREIWHPIALTACRVQKTNMRWETPCPWTTTCIEQYISLPLPLSFSLWTAFLGLYAGLTE